MLESLESSNRMLEKLSKTDGLTGLVNHRALFEQLDVERIESQELGTPLSIALLDLDDFKSINDIYGHLAGDSVLVSIARILVENTRDCDTVGRYGGDEFLVILKNADIALACTLFEKILALVRQVPVGENNHVSMSVGICEYQGENLTEYIVHGDRNLYKAKILGKNQIACFA
ncbi:GGDEF domain-containing protein [Sphaerochaeta pleomorpha]|uniref:GGDEF domain-containing protein n=1 Tax=Sphaerochaeta pleomorpha TaxID=1131707 RepID=UPI0012DDA6DC|nr:GGDEF domain-containing protein [Sphaerochaeta pleomorpha]